ncbi:hypothetical protein KFK09_025729 [Dendrobium nobile]|uniref:Uncharacterized protein n=1 Tax=Dendrobium nobile TaxID=94219 RepID=A0A8T3A5Z3_DENNO|nr:hypothetical protein KFK09_025729 [Dendrobium nobile]
MELNLILLPLPHATADDYFLTSYWPTLIRPLPDSHHARRLAPHPTEPPILRLGQTRKQAACTRRLRPPAVAARFTKPTPSPPYPSPTPVLPKPRPALGPKPHAHDCQP